MSFAARMGHDRLTGSMLSILTVITALCVLALMLRVGSVSWWFAPIVLAWNLSPLVAMRVFAARRDRLSPVWLPIALGLSYVAILCWGYYDAFYSAPSPMSGFAYILLPLFGWLGLALDILVDSCMTIWKTLKQR